MYIVLMHCRIKDNPRVTSIEWSSLLWIKNSCVLPAVEWIMIWPHERIQSNESPKVQIVSVVITGHEDSPKIA
jgi:hypothetical protein